LIWKAQSAADVGYETKKPTIRAARRDVCQGVIRDGLGGDYRLVDVGFCPKAATRHDRLAANYLALV
jgi:hypothetical protein